MIQPEYSRWQMALEDLLGISDPIELALVHRDNNGDKTVMSVYQVRWRSVLSDQISEQTIELLELKDRSQSIGLLDLTIEL